MKTTSTNTLQNHVHSKTETYISVFVEATNPYSIGFVANTLRLQVRLQRVALGGRRNAGKLETGDVARIPGDVPINGFDNEEVP